MGSGLNRGGCAATARWQNAPTWCKRVPLPTGGIVKDGVTQAAFGQASHRAAVQGHHDGGAKPVSKMRGIGALNAATSITHSLRYPTKIPPFA